GENCVNGGLKVTAGLDANGNGALDTDEVSSTNYVCNDQNVIFVDDDSASASEDGTKANPFKSIQAAVDSAADGSVIFVREGHYTDSLQIVNRNRLTVRGEASTRSSRRPRPSPPASPTSTRPTTGRTSS